MKWIGLIFIFSFSSSVSFSHEAVSFEMKFKSNPIESDLNFIEFNTKVFGTSTDNSWAQYLINETRCNNFNQYSVNSDVIGKIANLARPASNEACKSALIIKKERNYTRELCNDLLTCYIARSPSELIEQANLNTRGQDQVAKEGFALVMPRLIKGMIDLEELKNYAAKSYTEDFLPQSCRDKTFFDFKKDERNACRTDIIDQGYEIGQRVCSAGKVGCEPGYLDFIKNKTAVSGKESLLAQYIQQKADLNTNDVLGSDNDQMLQMAIILSNQSLSPSDRVEQVMKYLKENAPTLDPVMKSYYYQSLHKSRKEKVDAVRANFLSYIEANKNENQDRIYNDLQSLKKSAAREMLEKRCPSAPVMEDVCLKAREMASGADIVVDKQDFDNLMKRMNAGSNNESMTIQELSNSNARCNAIKLKIDGNREIDLSNVEGVNASKARKRDNRSHQREDKNSTVARISVEEDGTVVSQNTLPGTNSVVTAKLKATNTAETATKSNSTTAESDSSVLSRFGRNDRLPESYKKEDSIRSSSFQKSSEKTASKSKDLDSLSSADNFVKENVIEKPNSTLTNSASAQIKKAMEPLRNDNVITPPVVRNDVINPNFSGPIAETEDKTSKNSSEYKALVNKISGLEERLAAKDKKNATTIEGEKEVVTSDSSSTEKDRLAEELQAARKELADAEKKRALDAQTAAANKDASATTSVVVTGPKDKNSDGPVTTLISGSTAQQQQAAGVNNQFNNQFNNQAMNASNYSSSTVEGRDSGSSGSSFGKGTVASKGSAFGGSAAVSSNTADVGRGEAVILTKVSSNETKAIGAMIMAQSGQSFYIEDNGVVKEIVPEVVDGKVVLQANGEPVYKTVVKGKVGEFKVSLKDKEKKAVSLSPADVKMRDESSLVDVIRYRDLQDVLKRAPATK